MDLNEAIQHAMQVACGNGDCAYEHEQLAGWLTELEQYRNNPLANMKPCWKYVKRNGMYEQIYHVKTECSEVEDARGLEDKALECFDVLQSAVTLMYILQAKYNMNLQELFQRGIIKNTDREGGSYYE